MARHRFVLEPRPPFRLDLTAWALRRRAHNRVDRWDGHRYRRALAVGTTVAEVEVTQTGPLEAPRLAVSIEAGRGARQLEPAVTAALQRLLGLDIDLDAFHAFAAGDPRLAPLARRFHGLKPPRFTTPFEALINAIACQQLSLDVGILLLNRLALRFGARAAAGARAFPVPADLARRRPDSLRALGFSRHKAQAVLELARAVVKGEAGLDRLAAEDDAAAVARLCALRGVGRWSAEYVLLRGLGRTHVFPGDDVGARNNLGRWLHRGRPLDYAGVQRALAPWRPYGGLIYLHLLLDGLARTEPGLAGERR